MTHQDGSKKEELASLRSLLDSQTVASAALQNSEAMMTMERLRTVMGASVTPRLGEIGSIVAGFQNSEVTRTMERLKAAMGTSAFRTLGEFNPAIAALQNSELTRTTALLKAAIGTPVIPKLGEVGSIVDGLKNSEVTKMMERIRTVMGPSVIPRLGEISPAIAALQSPDVAKTMERLKGAMGMSVMPRLGEIGSVVAALQNSEVTKMMERMKSQGMMMPPGVSAEAVASIAVALVNGTTELVGESDAAVLGKASEIGAEIEKTIELDKLSASAKRVLFYIFDKLFVPFLIGYFLLVCQEHRAAAKEKMKGLSCPQEVRSAIRSGAGTFDKGILSGCRVVIGDRLSLRVSPNIKSDVIAELPVGAWLEVLDKSQRAWLRVEVEVDGELLQGWVFRRYTATFK